MARRDRMGGHVPATRASGRRRDLAIIFVCDGEERRVGLRAPKSILRSGRRLVQLIDLWVATLLPGDFLDLQFEVVTLEANGALRCSAPIGALHFARCFVDVARRTLWWSDAADGTLNGLSAQSIVVRRPAVVAPAPPLVLAPPVFHEPPVTFLQSILPRATHAYPAIEWRDPISEVTTVTRTTAQEPQTNDDSRKERSPRRAWRRSPEPRVLGARLQWKQRDERPRGGRRRHGGGRLGR